MKKTTNQTSYIGRSVPASKWVVLAGLFSLVILVSSLPAQAWSKKKVLPVVENKTITISDEEILENSQISYMSDGGFTGINSFGVVISCVKGRVSTLKSIHYPRQKGGPVRMRGSMDEMTYLNLWHSLHTQKVLQAKNVPNPKMDIADEFTVDFDARVGGLKNNFNVYGINRPEASHQFAIKQLIDSAVQMQAFLDIHEHLAFK